VLKLCAENLLRVTEILNAFSTISGLKCNIEKTHLMQIGSEEEINNSISDVGFAITNEITVLGMVLCNNVPEMFARNLNIIRDKVVKQIDFWRRFNLSLPGRINVAKSLIYSQLNYLGCFMPTRKDFCSGIDDMICNFVRGNMNIGKKRFFQKPADGGLGLFEINEFLMTQRCSWIRRAYMKIDDYWKHNILVKTGGNVLYTNGSYFSELDYPVLHNITSNYAEWLKHFWKYNENFKLAPIINNPILSLQHNGAVPITWNFFADYLPQHTAKIRVLTLGDVHNGNRFYSLDEFSHITGIPLTIRKLTALRGAYDIAVIRHAKNEQEKKNCMSIEEFIQTVKRGCQKFKKILYQHQETIPHNIIKFAENAEIVLNLSDSRICNKAWNISYLANDLRVFLFRFYNNTLGYNYMVSRFIANIEPYCTFCQIAQINELERETALHLFYTCPFTERLLEIFNEITGTDATIRRTDIFYRFDTENTERKNVLFIMSILFKKYIWDCKLRKCLPERNELIDFIKCETKCLKAISKNFSNMLDGSGLFQFFL